MIDFSRNHYELFDLPVRYAIDVDALEQRFRALQRDVHPDRFAAGDETEQRLALQASSRVNESFRALMDPVARAQHLLALHGVEPGSGRGALPVDFLERQLERREAAAQALADGDDAALDALLGEVRAEEQTAEAALATQLDRDGAWVAAVARVQELMFLRKLAADLDAMLSELEV